jgi:small basic protein (TIGR04137 family)
MSLHKTLKSKSTLSRHRNVLSRAERIIKLREDDRWTDEMTPFGLPKVAHRKVTVGGKTKKKEEEGATADDADKKE